MAAPIQNRFPRLLQFNYESTVTYNEDGFSTLTVKGTLEIPLTRDPSQSTRTFGKTADDFRGEIERRVMRGIDLRHFRMVRRNFTLSRDKRVLEWDFQAEEKAYMDTPPACSMARGSFSVKPAKAGMGLATWLCTLRATYTVRNDQPRRVAWLAFLALLRHRMVYSRSVPRIDDPKPPKPPRRITLTDIAEAAIGLPLLNALVSSQEKELVDLSKRAWLMDFSFDEGLYLDSKTVTFCATWKIVTHFSHVLLASGLWSRVEGSNKLLWATSISDVSGVQSWRANKAKTDIIVDFGGG